MSIHAVPKPTKTKKKTYKGLQRKNPLKTKLQGKKNQQNSKKSRNKTKRATLIPEAVMNTVRERSKGRDELDGLPGANQGHHIKHRSQNGLDLPINILHTSERNHPYKLHEDKEAITKAADILKKRIIQLFPNSTDYYHVETIAEELQTITKEQIERQYTKGWLKGELTSLGLVATQEQILSWLMPLRS